MELKPGYKQTDAGIIPEDWDVNTLESTTPPNRPNGIVDGPFGSNLKTIHYRKSGIPIITSGYVTEGKFLASEYLYVDKEKFTQEKRSAVNPGDIVMAKIGARCGASAILPNDHETGILSGNALKITVDNSRYSTYYIWQILWELYSKGNIEALRTVGAQPAISMANLKKFNLPLPPLFEQEAIAEALGDVDTLITALEQLIAKKRPIKQTTMQELLTGRTRLPSFIGEWEVKKVGEFGDVITGGTPPTLIGKYWNGNIPWVTPTDISDNKDIYTTEREVTSQGLGILRKLSPNSVLVTCIASIGKNAILRKEGACNQQINAVVPNKNHHSDFLYYLFENSKQYLLANAGKTATSILSKKDFSELEFHVPKLPEQTAIATILSDMDAEITALETKLHKTRLLKQGMMQQLLTGRIRLLDKVQK